MCFVLQGILMMMVMPCGMVIINRLFGENRIRGIIRHKIRIRRIIKMIKLLKMIRATTVTRIRRITKMDRIRRVLKHIQNT